MVGTRKRNHVATLPQIDVSNIRRVSQSGRDSIPSRQRMAIRTTATAITRIALCERRATAPTSTSMPAVPLIAANATVAAISQSRIECRVREDSMNRRYFILSSSATAAGLVLSRTLSFAQAPPFAEGYGGQAAQPAAPPVTRFEELRRG